MTKEKENKDINVGTTENPAAGSDPQAADEASIVQKVIEEAKAEAARIIAEAKAVADDIAPKPSKPSKPSKAEKEAEELVKATLFYDGDKYKDDVLVILNSQSWQIQRGVEVELPKKVWNVIRLSDKQNADAARMRENKQEEFRQARGQLE